MIKKEFIRYPEVYNILHDKYRVTHDELNYWIKRDRKLEDEEAFSYGNCSKYFEPFISDIPQKNTTYKYSPISCEPTVCFYNKISIENYTPDILNRFIYIRDLPLRLWHKWDRVEHETYAEYPSLEFAAKYSMLRFYDKNTHEFTLEKTFTLKKDNETIETRQLWYNTTDGQQMLSDSQTFFLLEDIIHIERVFNKRPLEECMKELGYNLEVSDDKDK